MTSVGQTVQYSQLLLSFAVFLILFLIQGCADLSAERAISQFEFRACVGFFPSLGEIHVLVLVK